MPNYHRFRVAGGCYFFTLVAHERRPLFTTDLARRCLREAIHEVRQRYPFELHAIVLLPEHLHCVWNLPPGDDEFSLRWRRIKDVFTTTYLAAGGTDGDRSPSREKRRERAVWQRRFWEHHVRDEDDLKRCLDYVHWNPVKHGLAVRPADYPWSTFRTFVERGEYDPSWGTAEVTDIPGAEWE